MTILVTIIAATLMTVVCFATFVLILTIDRSHFSEVNLKSQKKLATALFLQVSFIGEIE